MPHKARASQSPAACWGRGVQRRHGGPQEARPPARSPSTRPSSDDTATHSRPSVASGRLLAPHPPASAAGLSTSQAVPTLDPLVHLLRRQAGTLRPGGRDGSIRSLPLSGRRSRVGNDEGVKGTWTGCPRGSLPRMAQPPLPCLSLRVSTVQHRRSPGPFRSEDPDVASSDPDTLLGWGSSRASCPQNHTPPWGSHPARWAEPPPTRTVCGTCGGQGCASRGAPGPGPRETSARELGAGLEGSLTTQHAARRASQGACGPLCGAGSWATRLAPRLLLVWVCPPAPPAQHVPGDLKKQSLHWG